MPITDITLGLTGDSAVKNPCRVFTTENVSLSGLDPVGGIPIEENDRILVTEQTDRVDNGIYIARVGNWTRSPDFNGELDVVTGTALRVTAFGGSWWDLTTTDPIIGVSALEFRQTSSGSPGVGQDNYYILPLNGVIIRDGVGTLTLQGRVVDETGDSAITTGTIRLYANGLEVNTGNGFQPGSDGYTGVFDASNINGDLVVELRDGPSGQLYDSKSIVDVADGSPAAVTVIDVSNGLSFVRAPNGGSWNSTSTVLTAETFQSGVSLGVVSVTITLNTTAGTLSADITTPNVDYAVSFNGEDSDALTVNFQHISTGASESERVIAVSGGDQGESVYNAYLSRPSATVQAASDGTGYNLANKGGNFIINRGTQSLVPTTAFSVVAPATVDGLTMAISSAGLYSLSGTWTSDEATFTLRGVVDGLTFDRPYTITKARQGVDGGSGAQPEVVRVTYSNGSAWSRALNVGAWEPLSPTTDATFVWTQGALETGRAVARFTLNTTTGDIAVATFGTPTGGATIAPQNNNTSAVTAIATRGGIQESATVTSTQSGNNGADGESSSVDGIGTGAVGNITFAINTPSTNLMRMTGDTLFLKSGIRYDPPPISDIIVPSSTEGLFYLIVGNVTPFSRWGTGFAAVHHFFPATFDSAAGEWTARGSANQSFVFTPQLTDTMIAVGRRGPTQIESIASFINDLVIDSTNVGFYVQNGAINNAQIANLAASKISAGNIAANIGMFGELSVGVNGTIVADSGTHIKVIGVGFGSSGQFVEWFGPTVPVASMTEANAISYLKTNGDAYFGGSLSAGTLVNEATSSALSPFDEVIIGPFGTNGNAKQVVISYTSTSLDLHYGANPPGVDGQVVSVTATLTRVSPAATLLGTYVFNGTYTETAPIPTPQGDEYTRRQDISGSFTITDTTPGLQDFSYRLTLTANTNVLSPDSQRLSIISTE